MTVQKPDSNPAQQGHVPSSRPGTRKEPRRCSVDGEPCWCPEGECPGNPPSENAEDLELEVRVAGLVAGLGVLVAQRRAELARVPCPDCGGALRLAVRVCLPNGRAGARLDPCRCAPGAVLDPGGLELGPALTAEELAALPLGREDLDEEGLDRHLWRTLEQLSPPELAAHQAALEGIEDEAAALDDDGT